MITVSQALGLIAQHRPSFKNTQRPLNEALGHYAAADVLAKITMPPFDASAMDGYAVRLEDVKTPGAILDVIGEAPAGAPYPGQVESGQAVRIFTGGVLPKGATHIVIQEDTSREGDKITVNDGFDVPRHIRRAGIDFQSGDVLIKRHERISAEHIALAASGNHTAIPVYEPVKLAFISNGDELRPPGSELQPGEIINSNLYALSALAERWGAKTVYTGCAKDSLESISEHISSASDADIIVPVGGASVGDYDFMKQAFENAGFKSVFNKIAVRPGKPTWLAKSDNQIVLGLPGNPASAYVCAQLFLQPLLCPELKIPFIKTPLSSDQSENGPRETYLRGRISLIDGKMSVDVFPRQDSSLMTPLRDANTLIRLPANSGPWRAGDLVEIFPLTMEKFRN